MHEFLTFLLVTTAIPRAKCDAMLAYIREEKGKNIIILLNFIRFLEK